MGWNKVIDAVRVIDTCGPRGSTIFGVQYDSRRVIRGQAFVAMRGETKDGNNFVDEAIHNDAAAIITDSVEVFSSLRKKYPELPIAMVWDGRRALAELSAAVFGASQEHVHISAITGTNGKTTTAFLLEQMLQIVGRRCVLLGTIETHIAGETRMSERTTSESRDILSLLSIGFELGCSEAVMEVSSHALTQERTWGLSIDVAIFTNLSHDHLDYHGNMESYAKAKERLFLGVGAHAPRVAIINADDPAAGRMIAAASACEVLTYGMLAGDWRALDITFRAGQTEFRVQTPSGEIYVKSPLTGRVNVYNLLAAACAAYARGVTLECIAAAIQTLRQVPGRFEVVGGSRDHNFMVVVDYAHTEDALANLVALARELVGNNGGRVITLFGCGGDRDHSKRSKMGKVAGDGSDLVVVTSDNPRTEEPMLIIDEVLAGVRATDAEFIVEEDRRAALRIAIRAARPGDIVLLAGKGHEKEQILSTGPVPFDDAKEAARHLRELRAETNH